MPHFETMRDVLEACSGCQTKEEADEVLRRCKEDNPQYAEQNIGYMLGYLGKDERERLYPLFSTCNHPIFGSDFGRGYEPTTKEAFEAGKTFAASTD